MPAFTPEPHDHVDPVVPDFVPAPDPVVHSHGDVDVDAVLAAHAAGEHRVFHGWNMEAFNEMFGKHPHLRSHIEYDVDQHTLILR